MKVKSMIVALLLLAAGVQAAWGQGFRVYKSDGTVAQFSLSVDSIVFFGGSDSGGTIGGHDYDEIGGLKWAPEYDIKGEIISFSLCIKRIIP